MEWFQTKWDLLVSVNKDRGDTRWVDRQMAKGLIGHSEDGYYFVLDFLWWNNGELRKENEMLRERLDGGSYDKNVILENSSYDKNVITEGNNTWLEDLKGKLESMESDLEFQIKENERLEEKVLIYQEAIRNCYRWAKDVKKDRTPWPEFKKEVLKLEGDLPWEDNQ